jgi:hypothetical protein
MTTVSSSKKPNGSPEDDDSRAPTEEPNHESIKPEREKGDGTPG